MYDACQAGEPAVNPFRSRCLYLSAIMADMDIWHMLHAYRTLKTLTLAEGMLCVSECMR